jgi:monothiol glutaredoxin
MSRHILQEAAIHPAVRERVHGHHRAVVDEVLAAIGSEAVVVVGMRGNPFVGRARKQLTQAGVGHRYLEYGSYLSDWRRRNALKMWSGWPTFPMVFVRGTLIGGAEDLARLMASGEFEALRRQG